MQSEHPVKKSQRLYHPLNKSPRAPRYTWSSSLEGERKASKLQCHITPSHPFAIRVLCEKKHNFITS